MNIPSIHIPIMTTPSKSQSSIGKGSQVHSDVFTELLNHAFDQNTGLKTPEFNTSDTQTNDTRHAFNDEFGTSLVDLNLQVGVTGFDKLGVLVLRAINKNAQFVNYEGGLLKSSSEVLDGTDRPETNEYSWIENDPDTQELDERSISLDEFGSFKSSVLSGSNKDSSKVSTPIPKLMQSRILQPIATSISQTRVQPFSSSQYLEGSEPVDQAQHIVKIEELADLQNSEIEISVTRSELGLIIIITAPSIDPRMTKALEQRLIRLVETSGEKVDRIKINTTDMQYSSLDVPIAKEASHGSD